MASSWPFVGRAEEMRRIHDALREPGAAGMVVAGAAGVGKSRLVTRAIESLDGRRYAAFMAHGNLACRTIPFGAFAGLLPAQPTAPPGHLNPLRWATDELSARAAGRRLVLAVDDAHQLDGSSAALVLHLASTGAAFVLATVRTGEQAPDPVTALWTDGRAIRVELGPMTEDDTAVVLRAALGGDLDETTIRRLWTMSQGNVLLLGEIVIASLDTGALSGRGGEWHFARELALTPRLLDLVANRIGALTDEQRTVLELVAFGEPLGVEPLAKLTDLATVEEVEERQLIRLEVDGRRYQARVTHPLYGDVLRAQCPTLRARRLHGLLAEAIEATGARRRDDVLRTSLWRLESGSTPSPERLLAASNLAWAALDIGLAARFGRAALRSGGGVPAALMLAGVLNWAEEYDEAEAVLRGVADAPMTDQQRAVFAQTRGHNLSFGLRRPAEATAVIDEAAGLVHDLDARRQLATNAASYRFWAGRCAEAVRRSRALLTEPPAATAVEVSVLADAALALAHSGDGDEAIALADRACQLGVDVLGDAPVLALLLDFTRCYAAIFAGRLAAAERAADSLLKRTGPDLGNGWDAAVTAARLVHGQVARLRGDLRTARRWCAEAATASGDPRALLGSVCAGELAHLAAVAGDVDVARRALADADRTWVDAAMSFQYWVDIARPWVLAAGHRLDDAVSAALRTAERAAHAGFRGFESLALHDVVRLGEPAAVADRLAQLSDVDGELAPLCAEHAAAARDRERNRLEETSTGFERLGMILYAAEAAAEASEAHRASGHPRAAKRAGARAWTLAARCDGAKTPALAALAAPGLTGRERQVAQLAATGMSSVDIATRLVLSPRTVDNHLHRVYTKLGITGRDGLADLLERP